MCVAQVCGQQGLVQGLDQGGALGPADMVALAAAYPIVFIQVFLRLCIACLSIDIDVQLHTVFLPLVLVVDCALAEACLYLHERSC